MTDGSWPACVVGFGVAGQLHARILAEAGAAVTILDPKKREVPKPYRWSDRRLVDIPASVCRGFRVWSVCCPTAEHLPVLRAILERSPEARVIVEKPACHGHEIGAFEELLVHNAKARVVVVDQYRYARAVPRLLALMDQYEPAAPIDSIRIVFTKDRTRDIRSGRFVDRVYGVLGYEWVHMLTALQHLLEEPVFAHYLASDVEAAESWVTYDPHLFVSAFAERSVLHHGPRPLVVELATDILGPTVLVGGLPLDSVRLPVWRQRRRSFDNRHRYASVRAGKSRFAAHFEPVSAPGGWQLERNHHRVTVERSGELIHDEVIRDSMLTTALNEALRNLLSNERPPVPDLSCLRRVANIARFLQNERPGDGRQARVPMRSLSR